MVIFQFSCHLSLKQNRVFKPDGGILTIQRLDSRFHNYNAGRRVVCVLEFNKSCFCMELIAGSSTLAASFHSVLLFSHKG